MICWLVFWRWLLCDWVTLRLRRKAHLGPLAPLRLSRGREGEGEGGERKREEEERKRKEVERKRKVEERERKGEGEGEGEGGEKEKRKERERARAGPRAFGLGALLFSCWGLAFSWKFVPLPFDGLAWPFSFLFHQYFHCNQIPLSGIPSYTLTIYASSHSTSTGGLRYY